MLASLSMFPYSSFWRIDGQGFMKNTCGGIATVCAILILGVVSGIKLNQVFKKTTIIATSSSVMNLQPPMTNISTIQNNSTYMPYVIGLGFFKQDFYKSSNTVAAEYVVMTRVGNGSRNITRTNIILENCTANHFSLLPNINTKAAQWQIQNWLCLPLNKTYEIGGSYQLSSVYKRIQINVTCNDSQNLQDCGYVKQYTLNAAIDPTSLNPTTYYLSEDTFDVKAQAQYTYSSKVTINTLVVDNSVLPFSKKINTTSIETNTIILQQTLAIAPTRRTILKIEVNGKSITYNRSYFKLLDALSYIGGLVSTILGFFFFIEGFNRYFFQMRFATEYFKTKETKIVNFFTYIKSSLYQTFKGTSLERNTDDWKNAGKHGQIKTIVNKLLDVIYLNKRIAFLEQAISVIFEQHQLKGLHLIHSMNTQEAERSFHKHKFRQRLIYFIHKAQKFHSLPLGSAEGNESERDENKQLHSQIVRQKISLKSKSLRELREEENAQSDNKLRIQPISEFNQAQLKKSSQKLGIMTMKNIMEQQFGKMQSDAYGSRSLWESGIVNQAEQQYKNKYMSYNPERFLKKQEYKRIIKQQVEYIGQMQADDLKEGELVQQLETDLRKLMEEAENDTNKISATIYNRLDEWLKEELKHVIKQQKEEGKFNKLRTMTKITKKKDIEKSIK